MLRLRTFGGLWIENGHIDAGAASRRRPLAMLALLAIAGPRGLSREKVVSLLWPESDEEHGRNSLSHALTALRRDFNAEELVTGVTELRLNPDAITSDVEEFERCMASGERERAAALYAGPFLDGFFLREASEFERWVEEHRRRFHDMHRLALLRLAQKADKQGDNAGAVAWWRRLATCEPASAAAALGLMQALMAEGDRAAALQSFGVHEALLRRELGVEPEESVVSLAERLRNESSARTVPAPSLPNDLVSAARPASSASSTPQPENGIDRDRVVVLVDSGTAAVHTAWLNAGRPRRIARWSALAALAGVAAIGVIALRQTDRRPQYNPRQVVVTGFANRTGDSTLDAFGFLTADVITDALQRSGLVEVTDPATSLITVTGVRDSVARMDEGKELRLVATATRAGLVVTGRFSRDGDSVVIVARVSDAALGKLIAATEPVRASITAPDDALERVRQRVLGILAVRLDDRLRDVLPPGSTSPPTLPAYREYVDGLLQFQRLDYTGALPRFARAYELDSTFVAPLVWEAFVFGNTAQASERLRVIGELSRHVALLSPLDRYVLDFLGAWAGRDLPAQTAALEQASRLAPGSIWTYNLAARLSESGRVDEAVKTFEQIDRRYGWTRNWFGFWDAFTSALEYAGDHRRQLEIAREGSRTLPADLTMALVEARALAEVGRKAELVQLIARMQTLPDTRRQLGLFLGIISKLLWINGDTLYARQVRDTSLAWFHALPSEAQTTQVRFDLAATLYDAAQWNEARSLLDRVIEENPRDRQALMLAALCEARLGEKQAAEDIISRLLAERDSDEQNLMRAARIAAVLGDRERAVRFMKEYKDRGQFPRVNRAQFKDFAVLLGYPPYVALTRPGN